MRTKAERVWLFSYGLQKAIRYLSAEEIAQRVVRLSENADPDVVSSGVERFNSLAKEEGTQAYVDGGCVYFRKEA